MSFCAFCFAQKSGKEKYILSDSSTLVKHSRKTKLHPVLIPTALFGSAALLWSERENIRDIRNHHFPEFENHLDDRLYYLPIGAVYGLNLAGVKGRNSLGRATISLALSYALGSPLVSVLKDKTGIVRPNGKGENSFPSWHTTRAFLAASFMHKEFGHRSPWYSIGAYSTATATATWRMLNNKHWLPDVLTGAGIGILVTETSYWLLDLLLKERWSNSSTATAYAPWLESRLPHYIGIKTSGIYTSAQKGIGTAIEGAYFLNNRWGIEGSLGASHLYEGTVEATTEQYNPERGLLHAMIGPTLQLPLYRQLALKISCLGGFLHTSANSYSLNDVIYTYDYQRGHGLQVGTSVSHPVGKRSHLFLQGNLLQLWEKGDFISGDNFTNFRSTTSAISLGGGVSLSL
ncbi:hypothetical protein GCM10023331_38010 [Algivirga pacifica]|uniref:Phosphatidic acid phosphatase type 2/haloperoxidase domain-containing protein n=2 Tax=Algivirga pacifica TaxID=1162670 RepID=A0ABP9DNX3_9BACT